MSEELVTFFKALADSNRLKIVGLLAEKPYSVEELAALLDLKPSTISHHLARLSEAGVIPGAASRPASRTFAAFSRRGRRSRDRRSRSGSLHPIR